MERRKLSADEVEAAMNTLQGWKVAGDSLTKRFEFPDFAAALSFVNKVGELAESADHHPDIRLGWGYAEFDITTHDRGGVTAFDLDLAHKIDGI